MGKKLILETASRDDEQRKVIVIDWKALVNSEKIDEFEFPYYELPKMAEAYTRMWIIDVKKSELINEPLQLELFNKSKVTLTDELRAATSLDVYKRQGFQGRIPCIDARIGLGTECVSGEGLGEKRSDSWEGIEERRI